MRLRLDQAQLHRVAHHRRHAVITKTARVNGRRASDNSFYIYLGGLIGGGWGAKYDSDGMNATIAINDTGVGMSSESKDRIFERFFRVDDAHSTPGFGLGLPIAQSIIEKHEGWIDVESNPGQGTTFSIHLPQTTTEVIEQPILELATT